MIDQEASPSTAPQPSSAAIAPGPGIPAKPVAKRRRRRSWFGWLGFPSGSKAAWHVRQIWNHLRSLTGFRP